MGTRVWRCVDMGTAVGALSCMWEGLCSMMGDARRRRSNASVRTRRKQHGQATGQGLSAEQEEFSAIWVADVDFKWTSRQ